MQKHGKRSGPVSRIRSNGTTASDVAALVGVSQSTVSRVLNGETSTMIGEDTRQKVLNAAAEMGYSPNPLARALRGKKTHLLGLIVREIADPFFAEFVAELCQQARELNYQVVLGHAHSDPDRALQLTNVLETRHCDGVLVLGDLRDDETIIRTIMKTNRAVVGISRGEAPGSIPYVNSDNQLGMQMLLDHLYALGHRHMAFIDGGWLGDIRERMELFQKYLQTKGLPAPEQHIQRENNDFEGGLNAMRRLLTLSPRPTAVIASDDVMAIGALKAAWDARLKVPGDISISGFDDIPIAKYTSPSLTTVRQPVQLMSRQALHMVLDMIESKYVETPAHVVPELVIRESTGPVPA